MVFDNGLAFEGRVNNNFGGGGGGAVIGYRLDSFRIEAQYLYNYISSQTFTSGGCTLQNPDIFTPIGECPLELRVIGLGFNGNSNASFALINGLYDFYLDDIDSSVVPYLGIGIGGASVTNRVSFAGNLLRRSRGGSIVSTGIAAQIIVGVSYFMDDYAWISMDYSYMTTNAFSGSNRIENSFVLIDVTGNSNYSLNTLNFRVSFSFDVGSKDY